MNERDKKTIVSVRNHHWYSIRWPVKELLAIIDRLEIKLKEVSSDAVKDAEKTRIRGMREAINTHLMEENESLKAENEKLKIELDRAVEELTTRKMA